VIASGGVLPARARPTHDLIDQILALDPGRRGIATFFVPAPPSRLRARSAAPGAC